DGSHGSKPILLSRGSNASYSLFPSGKGKTGTIGATTNDVGVITLPERAGRVVLAVFVKESEAEVPQRERAIAQISRVLYDYFLFHSSK
ncbi:MAG: hypothetical protein ACE5JX_17395, partial [Acidobacteriota bacterium]